MSLEKSFLSHFPSLDHVTTFINHLSNLEKLFKDESIKDGGDKNVIIDSAIDYLTSLKTPTNPTA
jgi:hypothetical protein